MQSTRAVITCLKAAHAQPHARHENADIFVDAFREHCVNLCSRLNFLMNKILDWEIIHVNL
eukprot:1880415-Karenia_brevis.AAC.1